MAWVVWRRARSPQEQLGYKVIGGLIATRRRRFGWSQRYLEDRYRVDQAVISRVKNGKQFGVRWARFAALVGALGGLGDEPFPRDVPDRPRSPTRPPIDLSRGGLSAFDERPTARAGRGPWARCRRGAERRADCEGRLYGRPRLGLP